MNDGLHPDDTIAALASAAGPGLRSIVRISGPAVRAVVDPVFTPDDRPRWSSARRPRRHAGHVRLPGVHAPLPVDVLLWPTSRSYTGQPMAELHTIGSPPLVEALLQALFAGGARPAGRGEFTLRAFLAGRIDLVQAEAVLGVIEASDPQQLRLALGQLAGGISHRIAALHEELLLHLADLEAGLDFVEEDIEFISRDDLLGRLREARHFLERLLAQSSSRMQSTGRRRVVLAGLPNAGKSTLFNALAGSDVALVSPVPGTTRDYLSAALNAGGLAIELIDTAGREEAAAGIAGSADAQGREQWQQADLIVWCTPVDLSATDAARDHQEFERCRQMGRPLLAVTTKADLAGPPVVSRPVVSASRGEGLSALLAEIAAPLREERSATGSILGTTAARCHASLQGAVESLGRAEDIAQAGAGDELIALELREAVDHLGAIMGRTYTDDILDRIFSRFCIGK